MLNYEQGIGFLERDLHLDNADEKLRADRVGFLNRIIRAFHANVAFTNVYMQAVDLSERGYPLCDKVTPEEDDVYTTVTDEIYLKKAGLCIVLNGFFVKLLTSLGYDAFLSNAQVLDSPVPDNHTIILVRTPNDLDSENNVDDNSQCLRYIDVGIGFPTFEALPLWNLPCEYQFAFHRIKMEKRDDKYVRCHFASRGSKDGKWVDYIEFGTTPRHLNYFRYPSLAIYASPQYGHLILRKYMLAYFFPEGKGITLTNMTLRVWYESTKKIVKTDFDSIEALAEELPKYLPMLKKDLIKNAYIKWKSIKEE